MAGHLFKRSGSLLKTTVSGHLARCPDFEICCNGGLPTDITLLSGTGCYTVFNGTFALTPTGVLFPCRTVFSDTLVIPSNPCTAGTHCFSEVRFIDGANRTIYYYVDSYVIQVELSDVDAGMSVGIGMVLGGYYINSLGNCVLEFPGVGTISHTFTRSTCRTGSFSVSGSAFSGIRPDITGFTWPP